MPSIVANELKKNPALLAQHFATDLFHDGDYIEVDADKGVITLLNKKDISKKKLPISWYAMF